MFRQGKKLVRLEEAPTRGLMGARVWARKGLGFRGAENEKSINILATVLWINQGFAISSPANLEREKGSCFESSYIGVI